jgi:secondary thiamine-phosphate synthase enzyme
VSVQQGAAVRVCRDLVQLRTEKAVQFVDLTETVAERVRQSGVDEGMVVVQSRHTTAAVLVNENEEHLLEDLQDLLERWAPAGARYEKPNGHAHARALLLGTSVCLNVAEGRVDLGRWQSVFLVELDGPRRRSVSVQVLGVSTRGRP